MNSVEMRSPHRICGVNLANLISNEEIHRMAVISEDVTTRMKKNVLRLFEHVKEWLDQTSADL